MVAARVNWEDEADETGLDLGLLGLDENRGYHVFDVRRRGLLAKLRLPALGSKRIPMQTLLIHNQEMGTPPGTDHRRDFRPGTPVEAVVLSIEEEGKRISLSRAQALGLKERQDFDRFKKDADEASEGGFSTMARTLWLSPGRNSAPPQSTMP